MSSSISKSSSKPSKAHSQSHASAQTKSASSVSSHLAMVELKARTLSSISKLSDRDTHQIAIEDLEKIIRSLPADAFPMVLSSFLNDPVSSSCDSSGGRNSPAVARRESIRLLSLLCTVHPDVAVVHLPKIIAHIVRRLRDPFSDSSVRDACRDAAGSLAALYLCSNEEEANSCGRGGGGGGGTGIAGLFVKPLLEVMGEQNKTVQAAAAMCLAKVVEEGGRGSGAVPFQRLWPRICKMLGSQSFLAKGSMLSVISSLDKIGAISSQNMPAVLQNVCGCLENTDWATRKAAADTLNLIACHSGHLVATGTSQILSSLEACRFDKVKPVRDSIMESLQLWKKILGQKEDVAPEELKDGKVAELGDAPEELDGKLSNLSVQRLESLKDSSTDSSPTGSESHIKGKGTNLPEDAAILLKKKAPSLLDKEINAEFFQKLEARSSGDVPVEVVLPRRCPHSSPLKAEKEQDSINGDSNGVSDRNVGACCEFNENHGHSILSYNNTAERTVGTHGRKQNLDAPFRDKLAERFRSRDSKLRASGTDYKDEFCQKDSYGSRESNRTDALVENSFVNNKGNWLGIQRQLSKLERQQTHLLKMLQDFMGGSHDSLITLEQRVGGLERVVEEIAQDLSMSSGRRGGAMVGFVESPGRSLNKYNGLQDYNTSKFGRGVDSRCQYTERHLSSDNMVAAVRGRENRRSHSEGWHSYLNSTSRNGVANGRRGFGASFGNVGLPRHEEFDQVGMWSAGNKANEPLRLGEGPSARSVWQASKDEATLEAIRVAGEDNGTSQVAAQEPVYEMNAAVVDGNSGQPKSPLWASWTRAMNSLHIGDVDSAYAEVLSTGDDVLLVKLMERSGPVINELSCEIAGEVLPAVGQFLLEQSLCEIALAWFQQLLELVMDNGEDYLGIPLEAKREILLNLHEASTMEHAEDLEGASAEQILVQLASAWGINIQLLMK